MSTAETIERARRMNEQLGPNDGACFGTLDPSRLRQGSPVCRALRRHDYVLVFSKAGKCTELYLRASSKWGAYREMKIELEIVGRLSVQKFLDAGGEKLLLGGKEVFPSKLASHRGGGK
jgi:hypothetical protein